MKKLTLDWAKPLSWRFQKFGHFVPFSFKLLLLLGPTSDFDGAQALVGGAHIESRLANVLMLAYLTGGPDLDVIVQSGKTEVRGGLLSDGDEAMCSKGIFPPPFGLLLPDEVIKGSTG